MSVPAKPARHNLVLSSLFLLMIFVPFVFFFFSTGKTKSYVENRTLSEAPKLPTTAKDLQSFPSKFDSFFSDHFGFRDFIIRGYNIAKFGIGDSPTDDITIGKEGWLYLGSPKPKNKYPRVFTSMQNTSKLEEQNLRNIAANFEQKRLWLAEQGIDYIFLFVPEKHTVYPEYLPNHIDRQPGPTAADVLKDYLLAETNIRIVDVKPAILERKKKVQVYYKTDTHWNHEGAYVAFNDILRAVNEEVPQLRDDPLSLDVKLVDNGKFRGDISNFVGVDIYDVFSPNPVFENTCTPANANVPDALNAFSVRTCDTRDLKTVVFGDSFSAALNTYFSRIFSKTTVLRERSTFDNLKAHIEYDKPDLIIEQWVERKVEGLQLPSTFVERDAEKLFSTSTENILTIDPDNYSPNSMITLKSISETGSRYEVQGGTGYLHLKSLEFDPTKSYVLEIEADFSSNSTLQLFYSDATRTAGPIYSNSKMLRQKTTTGQNIYYFDLGYKNLGSSLRIHPSLNPGETIVKSIRIREVAAKPKAIPKTTP